MISNIPEASNYNNIELIFIEAGAYAFFFPYGTGHVMGLPELMDLWRSQNKFNEFMNWDEVSKYRFFGGIRNEEDFLMTENGAQLLGKPKPKTVEEIEAIRVEVG